MKASKRRIVLERIAIEFDPGLRYDEREVNAVVGRFFTDHAALRRYLVDEGFLDREAGVYWRARRRVTRPPEGGSVRRSRRAGVRDRRSRAFR